LSVEDLESMEGIEKIEFTGSRLDAGIDVVSLLAETNIFPSKGEARKMIMGGGVSFNRKKLENVSLIVDKAFLLHGKYIMIQKGKKNHYLIKVI
jgi:tyrosyl-tRNA synthetase